MTRRVLVPLPALFAAALIFALPASAATKGPVVKSVSPLKLKVGQKLTLHGRGFVPGKHKTRVTFVRVNGKGVATAAADKGSRTKVVVTVPVSLNTLLAGKSARFKLRVLAKRYGKWTTKRLSPVLSPLPVTNTDTGTGTGTGPSTDAPAADCDHDGVPNSVDTDDDNDLLPDTLEGPDVAHGQTGTDPCNPDTDGDGVQDGYEYESALDLNRTVLFGTRPPTPYPGKRPYPNPLYPDASVDYDGDGLTLSDEQSLWLAYGNHQFPLNYSDGMQTTVPTPAPTDAVLQQLDSAPFGPNYHDGQLSDGERDADGDGLSNWDESHGRMTPDWWLLTYNGKHGLSKETPYPVQFGGTSMTDQDTDGDGIPDGLDDQDHDGLSNEFEVARPYNWASTYISLYSDGSIAHTATSPAIPNPYARVNPFNPCKPVYSSSCHQHPPFDYYGDSEDWEGMYPADAVADYGAPGAIPGPIFAP